jgi:hypothetical protein
MEAANADGVDCCASKLLLAASAGCELGAGLFFHQQQGMPGWAYPLVYLVTVPLLVYFPTHPYLDWLTRRWQR